MVKTKSNTSKGTKKKAAKKKYQEMRSSHLVFPNDANHHGTLFGGIALQYMDIMAFLTANRNFKKSFVTASSERNDFKVPVKIGHIIELVGKVAKVGRTSVTVDVKLYSEHPLKHTRKLCTQGRFVMVSVDENQKPIPLKS